MKIVIIGLSITSSWGNGHATTFRALVKELDKAGHSVTFLERDVPWYAKQRDMPNPPFGSTHLYADLSELKQQWAEAVATADAVIVGSYVPDGVAVGDWVNKTATGTTAFYDIDTPVTLAKLAANDFEYLHPRQIADYQLYLSFTGGPILDELEQKFGSPMAKPLYCSVDPELYQPQQVPLEYDLGYLGTYSDDRQPPLEQLLVAPAKQLAQQQFVVAGPLYPEHIQWPQNVKRIQHLPPAEHCAFYCSQRFTLNITRAAMKQYGYAPSVRLFEAAACGVPIISDWWEGLDTLFTPGEEIFIAHSATEAAGYLTALTEQERTAAGEAGRKRILAEHTSAHRAQELVQHLQEARVQQAV